MPLIRSRESSPRRKDRRLLVGVLALLAAATCGLALASWVLPRVRQARAAREIRRLGGTVYFEGEALAALGRNPARRRQRPEEGPSWLERALGSDLGGNVVAIDLRKAEIDARDLEILRDLPHLEEVALPLVGVDGLRPLLHTPVEYVSLGASSRLGIEGRASLIAAIQALAIAVERRER